MGDTGTFQVNMDEAVLSGKVTFQNNEHVLLLLPGLLVCRGFATEPIGFSLKLDQITGCFQDKKKANEFHLTAIVPRSPNDPLLVNASFDLRCAGEEEVLEWVDTLQSVVTDRNIRAIEAERTRNQQRDAELEGALTELKSIFPDMDDELIKSILIAKGGNLQRALDELLGMSDPNFKGDAAPVRQAPLATSTPQDQMLLDEQLALALQDELFLEQVNRDEGFRRALGPGQQAQDDFSITEKIQEMSDAAKRKMGELYFKFKKATSDSKGEEQDIPGQEMQAMKKSSEATRDASREQSEEEDDDDDVPLERPGNKLFGRSDGYQPLPATSRNPGQRGFGQSDLNDDDL